MYLHLGQNFVVPEADIIGIFDMDNTTSSHITRKFLSEAEKSGRVTSVSDGLPNSFVVCAGEESRSRIAPPPEKNAGSRGERGKTKVYLSQLSSQTLLKRSGTMQYNS